MTGPIPLPRQYPAHLQLCYRGVKYRPAALQLFVARGGWGPEYIPTTKPPVKAALRAGQGNQVVAEAADPLSGNASAYHT